MVPSCPTCSNAENVRIMRTHKSNDYVGDVKETIVCYCARCDEIFTTSRIHPRSKEERALYKAPVRSCCGE